MTMKTIADLKTIHAALVAAHKKTPSQKKELQIEAITECIIQFEMIDQQTPDEHD